MVIQPILLDRIIDHIDSNAVKAKVTIDGVEKDYGIFRTVKRGSMLRKYVYIETDKGVITEAKLLDINDVALATKATATTKGENGFMLVFEFNITVEGA